MSGLAFPWWMPLASALFSRGNDGLTRPERKWLARRFRRTVAAPLAATEKQAIEEWRHRRGFRARYDAAHRVETWGERMDALLTLMKEDPTLFAETAREAVEDAAS